MTLPLPLLLLSGNISQLHWRMMLHPLTNLASLIVADQTVSFVALAVVNLATVVKVVGETLDATPPLDLSQT